MVRAVANVGHRDHRVSGDLALVREQGLTDADISRIHAPIGLDIGAVSPAEIAVAIIAQITERLREEPQPDRAPVRAVS